MIILSPKGLSWRLGLQMIRSLLFLAFWALVLPPSLAAAPLKVGVHGTEPFFRKNGDIYDGISVDLWHEVAEANGLAYQFLPQTDVDSSVKAVADGTLDAAIGQIEITPGRMSIKQINFTQPYYFANHTILLHQEPPDLISRLKPFFAWAVLSSIGLLVGILFLVGNLIWLAERRNNTNQFPQDYFQGVGNGMWLALVTLTTVGFGDLAPMSRTGRAITSIWMVFSLVAVSSITAGLASAFTVSLTQNGKSLVNPGQIRGRRIAVIIGSSSVATASAYGGRPIKVASLEKAAELLISGKVDGVIFDRPSLRYYIKQNPDKPLKLASFNLSRETFGFVLHVDNPYLRSIDVELLRLYSTGKIDEIANRILQ